MQCEKNSNRKVHKEDAKVAKKTRAAFLGVLCALTAAFVIKRLLLAQALKGYFSFSGIAKYPLRAWIL